MGDQLYPECFVWFDNEARRERYPNASKLGEHFEIAPKTAQRSIDHFRDRLQAPLEYDLSHKGYFYTDPTFQLPIIRISEEELLALLISRKLLVSSRTGRASTWCCALHRSGRAGSREKCGTKRRPKKFRKTGS